MMSKFGRWSIATVTGLKKTTILQLNVRTFVRRLARIVTAKVGTTPVRL